MKNIGIIQERCPQNHYCPVIRICPVGAIVQSSPLTAPAIDEDKCTRCGKCTSYCGYNAFVME